MIETVIVFVIIVLLLAGVSAVAGVSTDQNTATTAVRAGGRFAAELGNGSSLALGGSTNPFPVDSQIVGEVCKVMNTMPNLTTINQVIVYQPQTNPDGSYSSSDAHDVYTFTSVPNCQISQSPPLQYTLDLRKQVHPNESQVGVYVQYHYKSPTPFFKLDMNASVYTVVTVAPSYS
jgi:type II secretory pathway pseudopilin PulG